MQLDFSNQHSLTNMKLKDWFPYDYYFCCNGYDCCGKWKKMLGIDAFYNMSAISKISV